MKIENSTLNDMDEIFRLYQAATDFQKGKNEDPAVYIHRIATNPDFRGQNLVTKIVRLVCIYH